jgi:predicted NodU family carbamoyl transferase
MVIYIPEISVFYNDAIPVLLKNDEVMVAAQEERFARKKYDVPFSAQTT